MITIIVLTVSARYFNDKIYFLNNYIVMMKKCPEKCPILKKTFILWGKKLFSFHYAGLNY